MGEEEACLCKIRALTWDQVCGTDLGRIGVVMILLICCGIATLAKLLGLLFCKIVFLGQKKGIKLYIGGILVSGMSWSTYCFKYAITVFLLSPPLNGVGIFFF